MESGVRELEQAQRAHGTEGDIEPDVALDENITNQAQYQVNNNENRHVADKTQPVMSPPEILGAPHDDRGEGASPLLHRSDSHWRFAARTKSGVRELKQAQRAHGTEGNNMEPDVALDEYITNHANDKENDFETEGQLDAAVVDNNNYQACNNDSHSVVDASVGDVANIGAVENIEHREANNNDDNYVVNAPMNIADIVEVADVVIITTKANNDDNNHDIVNAPGDGSVTAVAAFNRGLLDEVNVETITEDKNENYEVGNADNEQAQDSTHTNRLLQSLSQQLWEKRQKNQCIRR